MTLQDFERVGPIIHRQRLQGSFQLPDERVRKRNRSARGRGLGNEPLNHRLQQLWDGSTDRGAHGDPRRP